MRKCNECNGLGINSKVEMCLNCTGENIQEQDININFNCKMKHTIYKNFSHEEYNKIPGDITVNILPKKHEFYEILDNYNSVYNYIIEDILEEITITIKHSDNKIYKFKIKNPISRI